MNSGIVLFLVIRTGKLSLGRIIAWRWRHRFADLLVTCRAPASLLLLQPLAREGDAVSNQTSQRRPPIVVRVRVDCERCALLSHCKAQSAAHVRHADQRCSQQEWRPPRVVFFTKATSAVPVLLRGLLQQRAGCDTVGACPALQSTVTVRAAGAAAYMHSWVVQAFGGRQARSLRLQHAPGRPCRTVKCRR